MTGDSLPGTKTPREARLQGGMSSERAGARSARRVATRLILLFLFTAGPWVLFSDVLLASLRLPLAIEHAISSAKGIFFVAATAVILYVLAQGHLRRQYAVQERYRRLFENAEDGLTVFRVETGGSDFVLSVESTNPAQARRMGATCADVDAATEEQPCCPRFETYFSVVRKAVEAGQTVREEVSFEDGQISELLMVYPIQSNLWVLAAMDITSLRQAERELKDQEARIRQLYVDVFDAVTGGKLLLMTEEEIHSALGEPLTSEASLQLVSDLAVARKRLREAVIGLDGDSDLLTAVVSAAGEAFNNALKHAGSGEYGVFTKDGRLQVHVADEGSGIDFHHLPRMALVPGFSTVHTLGMGFTIMLQLAERMLLSTRPGRTEIVLEFPLTRAEVSQPERATHQLS